MLKFVSKLFKSDAGFTPIVAEINALEPEVQKFTIEELKGESEKLKREIQQISDWEKQKEALDKHLPRAFALVREAAKRTLGQRHFDVQLMGGVALHEGKIAEMRTGEGKTLAATAPVYLNALAGRGVHVVTVNEYLAKRDAVWMGQIYHALGLTVTCLIHEGALLYDPHWKAGGDEAAMQAEKDSTAAFLVHGEFLRPIARSEAYQADITYGTNHEFGFDYLRDNLAHNKEGQVQVARQSQRDEGGRDFSSSVRASAGAKALADGPADRHFAVIDEVDSILIDEARTPLIIAAPDTESSQFYKTFARVAANLKKDEDYLVDEKMRSVDIIEAGIDKVEKVLSIQNLYAPENLRLTHYLQESLRAKELFLRDRDYVVKDGEIIIVDQFTGRMMLGRRYSGGLHQAIEAKENVQVRQESRTYASISIQNYFRLYRKLAGMTGTAQTSAEEFDKVYKLEVTTIPTNKPMVRTDEPDLVYKTRKGKYEAIIKDIKARHEKGQPMLVGTVSIEKNEELSRELTHAGLRHEVLNAKNNEREGAIIAQAGKRGAITVATNVAGRGVDIILGGNPPSAEEARKVLEVGGLHVVGTERHESRRIDNQLRGRAGRQGDPGSSQFFLSLEDDLMRIFGGDRVGRIMETFKLPEDVPIQAGMINRVISQAQAKVEGNNFDARKHLLEYDDVLNKQRLAMYQKRQELLESGTLTVTSDKEKGENESLNYEVPQALDTAMKASGENSVSPVTLTFSRAALPIVLSTLDMFWMNHLENMEALQESVRLRAYGQHDPLVEYRREGHLMFRQLLAEFETWIKENGERLNKQERGTSNQGAIRLPVSPSGQSLVDRGSKKVGRNDPCPCGALNPTTGQIYKYKKCGLINAPHHKK
jgi:preprotein translocase subunit SecA